MLLNPAQKERAVALTAKIIEGTDSPMNYADDKVYNLVKAIIAWREIHGPTGTVLPYTTATEAKEVREELIRRVDDFDR